MAVHVAVVIAASVCCATTGVAVLATQPQTTKFAPASVEWDLNSSDEVVEITLQNNRKDVALEAWQFTVTFSTPSTPENRVSRTEDSYAALALPFRNPDVGPIEPKQSRRFQISVVDAQAIKSVALDFALYGDGIGEGDGRLVKNILAVREASASELSRWIDVLSEADKQGPVKGREYLAATLKKAQVTESSGSAVGKTVLQLVRAPELEFLAVLEMKSIFERQRELALRHRTMRKEQR